MKQFFLPSPKIYSIIMVISAKNGSNFAKII